MSVVETRGFLGELPKRASRLKDARPDLIDDPSRVFIGLRNAVCISAMMWMVVLGGLTYLKPSGRPSPELWPEESAPATDIEDRGAET